MREAIRRTQELGQTVMEYALVVALISVVAVVALLDAFDGVIPACQTLVEAVL
jgi:hypothetical protein